MGEHSSPAQPKDQSLKWAPQRRELRKDDVGGTNSASPKLPESVLGTRLSRDRGRPCPPRSSLPPQRPKTAAGDDHTFQSVIQDRAGPRRAGIPRRQALHPVVLACQERAERPFPPDPGGRLLLVWRAGTPAAPGSGQGTTRADSSRPIRWPGRRGSREPASGRSAATWPSAKVACARRAWRKWMVASRRLVPK